MWQQQLICRRGRKVALLKYSCFLFFYILYLLDFEKEPSSQFTHHLLFRVRLPDLRPRQRWWVVPQSSWRFPSWFGCWGTVKQMVPMGLTLRMSISQNINPESRVRGDLDWMWEINFANNGKKKKKSYHLLLHLLLQRIQRQQTPLSISSSSLVEALPGAWAVSIGAFGSGRVRRERLSNPAGSSSEPPWVPEEKQSAHWIFKLKQPNSIASLLAGIPQRIHGLAARLPTAKSNILPFVNCVQELDIYPLVHGLGVPEISEILKKNKTVSM